MKQLLKRCLRHFGIDLVRYDPPPARIGGSKRTQALGYCETATGNYYLPEDAPNDLIAHAIRNNQIFDADIVEVARQCIKPGTAVLDVGANFGQMSILFSNITGEQGHVYSFEADDFVFSILTKNIDANGRTDRIKPVFGAVYNVADQPLFFPVQDFVRFKTYGSYGIDPNAASGRQVKAITIDALDIREPVSFMKVDVQGSDLPAMQGAIKTIEKNRMPIVFEYEFQFELEYKLSFQEYVDFVRDIDYKFERVINGYNYLIVPK